jgi:hypothetical protein
MPAAPTIATNAAGTRASNINLLRCDPDFLGIILDTTRCLDA